MVMKVYKSKISSGLLIFSYSIIGIDVLVMIILKNWIAISILLLLSLFIIHIFRNTWYKIDGDSLHIRSGFIYRSTIKIPQVIRISSTRSFFSAPALSLDRLEILYNKFDSVVISPEHQEEFVRELKNINPNIESKI
jgi:Bacterial PH domain